MEEEELNRIAAGMRTVDGITVFDDDIYAQETESLPEQDDHAKPRYPRRPSFEDFANCAPSNQ